MRVWSNLALLSKAQLSRAQSDFDINEKNFKNIYYDNEQNAKKMANGWLSRANGKPKMIN